MGLTLSIDMSNATFKGDGPASEICKILLDAIKEVAVHDVLQSTEHLYDSSGNRVASVSIEE
jgi:hypothetical protein